MGMQCKHADHGPYGPTPSAASPIIKLTMQNASMPCEMPQCVCNPVWTSLSLCICGSLYLSLHIVLYVPLTLCPSVCMCCTVRLSVPSVSLVCPSLSTICLYCSHPLSLSISLPLFLYLSLSLSVSVCPSLCLCVCVSMASGVCLVCWYVVPASSTHNYNMLYSVLEICVVVVQVTMGHVVTAQYVMIIAKRLM
jgi:hypothetical protein